MGRVRARRGAAPGTGTAGSTGTGCVACGAGWGWCARARDREERDVSVALSGYLACRRVPSLRCAAPQPPDRVYYALLIMLGVGAPGHCRFSSWEKRRRRATPKSKHPNNLHQLFSSSPPNRDSMLLPGVSHRTGKPSNVQYLLYLYPETSCTGLMHVSVSKKDQFYNNLVWCNPRIRMTEAVLY